MITFSCKKNESIVIGDGIVVTVLDIQGPHVHLGIEHGDGPSVYRREAFALVGQATEAWDQEE
jgi:carbon storage regulator